MSELVLVTGGTGKTGRRVAQRLAGRGVGVRIGSRAGTPPFDRTEPAAEIGAVVGREIRYVPVSVDEYAEAATAIMSPEEARAMATPGRLPTRPHDRVDLAVVVGDKDG